MPDFQSSLDVVMTKDVVHVASMVSSAESFHICPVAVPHVGQSGRRRVACIFEHESDTTVNLSIEGVLALVVKHGNHHDFAIKEVVNQRNKSRDDTAAHGMRWAKTFEKKQPVLKCLYLLVETNGCIYRNAVDAFQEGSILVARGVRLTNLVHDLDKIWRAWVLTSLRATIFPSAMSFRPFSMSNFSRWEIMSAQFFSSLKLANSAMICSKIMRSSVSTTMR